MQPQARALDIGRVPGPEKAFEKMLLIFPGYTDPVILYG